MPFDAKKFIACRVEANLTQKEVADRCKKSPQHISMLESGEWANARIETLEVLAAAVGKTVNDICTPAKRPVTSRRRTARASR